MSRPEPTADVGGALQAQIDKLQAFKAFCHAYLDAHGVPHHPPGTHGAEGCRIGDRMDWLMARVQGPRWTAEPPTVAGWYWWRNPDYPPSVESPWMRLVRSHRGVVVCDEPFTRDVKVMGGEWAGPLCPPSP